MPSIQVDRLNHTDPSIAGQIWTIQQAAYAVEAALIGYSELPPLRETVQRITRSGEVFLGASLNAALVGVLSFNQPVGRQHICRLAVDPRCVRRGVASALLHSAERIATQRKLTVSTAERNAPALALYRKHGFTITQRTTTPDGLVLVLLTKWHSPPS